MCRRLLRDRALDSEYFSSCASVHLASSRLCLMLCEYLGRVGRVSLFRFLVPSLSLTNMTITCDSTAKAVSHKQLAKKIHKSSPPAVFHSSHPFPQHHFSRHHIFACAALQTPQAFAFTSTTTLHLLYTPLHFSCLFPTTLSSSPLLSTCDTVAIFSGKYLIHPSPFHLRPQRR